MLKTSWKKAVALTVCTSFIFCSLAFGQEKKDAQSVVIIGGGVGALTSAIYLARSGVIPIVIEGRIPGGALSQSPKVQNWPGEFEISGMDLMDKIRSQAIQNGVVFLQEEVTDVDLSKRPFKITSRDVYDPSKTHVLEADSCIIATGSEAKRLHVKGEDEYWSKGVYSCAICDGSLYKGQIVAVIGGGDAALTEAEYLSLIAKKVYVIVRKDTLRANEKQREAMLRTLPNVEFLFESEIQEIKGSDDAVNQVVLVKKGELRSLDIDAVFLAIGSRPNSELFTGQLKLDPNGYIKVINDVETTVAGVYAIGDIADPYFKQAISAAGDGAKAALKAHNFLLTAPKPQIITSQTSKKSSSYSGKVIEVTSYEHFQKELKEASTTVLVDFYATWCGPCRQLSPKLEEFAKELQGKAKILKVNIESCEDLAMLYQIRSMPTLVVIDNSGKQVGRKTGTKDIIDYIKTLK
ncbi:MAG: FAD-dependent oxidoreductase [Chlamydiae bacterium]|nr:FAD-dependent oxidoreductase [Chlamydiota bacterium]